MEGFQDQKARGPSWSEIEFMKHCRRNGLSYASIGEKLYDKYGYTLDVRDIWKLVKGRG